MTKFGADFEQEPPLPPDDGADHRLVELADGESDLPARYSLGTIIAGLLLAASLLGSMLWRAFPPSVLLRHAPSGLNPADTSALPLQLEVPAASQWVDSGVLLQAGHSYRLTVQGEVVLNDRAGFELPTGPQGFSSRCRPSEGQACTLAGAPFGALIGRLDRGEPFQIGAVLLLQVGNDARLWLAVNDLEGSYRDNQGHFSVLIERVNRDPFQSVDRQLPQFTAFMR